MAENATRRRAKAGALPPPDAHGKSSTYQNWICRCEPCRRKRALMAELRALRAQSTPT